MKYKPDESGRIRKRVPCNAFLLVPQQGAVLPNKRAFAEEPLLRIQSTLIIRDGFYVMTVSSRV